jgi:arginase family enzyme
MGLVEPEYLCHAGVERVPRGSELIALGLPHLAEPLLATRYLAGLLGRFEAPARLAEVLESFPFERAAAERFLRDCVRAGLLVEATRGPLAEPDLVAPRQTFLCAPRFDPAHPPSFVVLGVPWDGGTTGHPGARHGPAALREASLAARYLLDPLTLSPSGFFDHASGRRRLEHVTVADAGDLFVAPGEGFGELGARLTRVARGLLHAGSIPLVLGGDHSITLPLLRALPAEPLQILHLDAHTDLGDVGPSGVHHGNVFSAVLDGLPHVARVVQVGLRGLLPAAHHQEEARVVSVGMHRLRAASPEAVAALLDPELPCWISVDVDVVDPAFAPATGTPVPGGLWPHELDALLEAATGCCPVLGVELVEVAATGAAVEATAALGVQALVVAADGIVQRLREAHEEGR